MKQAQLILLAQQEVIEDMLHLIQIRKVIDSTNKKWDDIEAFINDYAKNLDNPTK